jgi:ribonucleoside-triphosphate reductase
VVDPKIIADECTRAGISFWLASEVALALKELVTSTTSEYALKRMISEELKKRDKSAYDLFKNFHSIYVRTSKLTLDGFERERIVNSLIKETGLPSKLAESIASDVEEEVKKLGLRFISGALIREIVNSKLLDGGLINEKIKYSRLGVPVFDVEMTISHTKDTNPSEIVRIFGNSVISEFTLTRILDEESAKAHLTGDINIHGLRSFALRPTNIQNDLRWLLERGLKFDGTGETTCVAGPPKKASAIITQAVRMALAVQTNVYDSQSFDFFNIFLSPFLKRMNDRNIKQIAETFIYGSSTLHALREYPFFSVNLEQVVPDFLRNKKIGRFLLGDYVIEAKKFFNLFLDVLAKGDYKKGRFKWPSVILKLRREPSEELFKKILKTNAILVNEDKDNTNFITPKTCLKGSLDETLRVGNVQEVSLNMPRLALLSDGESDLFEKIDEKLALIRNIMQIKRRLIEERINRDRILPFISQRKNGETYFKLKQSHYVVRVVGLNECVKSITEETIGSEPNFAERVLGYLERRLDDYSEEDKMSYTVADSKGQEDRFHALDLQNFGTSVIPRKYVSIQNALGKLDENRKIDIYAQIGKHFKGGFLAEFPAPRTFIKFKNLYRKLKENAIPVWGFHSL